MTTRILVALSTFGEYGDAPLRLLRESGFAFSVNPLGKRLVKEEIIEMAKDCEGIIAGVEPYDEFVLERLPKLRCISRCGIGIDNISADAARRKGIMILNTPDVVIQPVAELTIAMIFDLLRKLTFHTILLKSKSWKKFGGHLLAGRRVGILGLGRIGKRVAEMLVKLDADVYGTDVFPDERWAEKTGVKLVSLDELLRISDIVSIHVSPGKNNALILGEKEIRSMKKGALLINTARGQVADESAVFHALKDNHLGGAAFDVFPQEPYQGMWCGLDQVVMTPHVATLTEESRLQMEIEATSNIIRFFKSESRG